MFTLPHPTPCQPLRLTLSPHLNIHIQSQENICITFISDEHSLQLKVGSERKVSVCVACAIITDIQEKKANFRPKNSAFILYFLAVTDESRQRSNTARA